jgi:hypothetical protein
MSSDDEDDIKNEKSLVAEGVLRAIIKMIELFSKYDDVFPLMEAQIEEIIHWGFRDDNFDNLFDILDIIETIVKHSPTISKKTWSYYTPLIDSLIGSDSEIAEFKQKYPDSEFEGLGYDSLAEYIPIFSYYMTK